MTTAALKVDEDANMWGHNPLKPRWSLFKQAKKKADLPPDIIKLMEGMKAYYVNSSTLPTLSNLNEKLNKDGKPRSNRSDGREAECLVMQAILSFTEFSTLRVGTPKANGSFVHRSFREIAEVAGLLSEKSTADNLIPSRRFWRAVRRLKLAGAFTIHRQYEKKPDGTKRARPAIKSLNHHFLVNIGKLTYKQLKKFRTWCTNELSKKAIAFANDNPGLKDAKDASNHLRLKQATQGIKTNQPKKKPAPELHESDSRKELKIAYNRDKLELITQLRSENSRKDVNWILKKTTELMPRFEDWEKLKR
jgi:hypothetical protein